MEKRNDRVRETEYKSDFIFGIHAVEEAIKSGKEIERIVVAKGIINAKQILQEATLRKIPYVVAPPEKLNRITMKNHQGVIAYISPIKYESIEEIVLRSFEKGEDPFILILDRVTDVRNFGAIARTAECAGVHAIVIPSKGSAQIQEDAVKTSSGALHYIPVCREDNLKNTLKYLKDSGLLIIGCTEKGEKMVYESNIKGPLAVIMGSEEDGISSEYLKLCDLQVKIPLLGEVSSLNVSVATGVILYEAVRQNSKQ